MANEIEPRLNVYAAELQKLLGKSGEAIATRLPNVYEGSATTVLPEASRIAGGPLLALLEGLTYSSEVGAGSEHIARGTSVGKIKNAELLGQVIAQTPSTTPTTSTTPSKDFSIPEFTDFDFKLAEWRAKPVGDRSTAIAGTGGEAGRKLVEPEALKGWNAYKGIQDAQGIQEASQPQALPPSSAELLAKSMAEFKLIQQDPSINYFDKTAKLNEISGLKAAVVAEANKNALNTATDEYGIPSMYRALEDSRARDRADPYWEKFRSDSPITLGILNEIRAAESSAMGRAQKHYMSDPTVAELDKSVTPFIKTAEATLQNEFQKLEREASIQSDLLARYPNATPLAEAANPELRGLPNKEELIKAATTIVRTPMGQAAWAAQDSPSDLMSLSLAGNPEAAKLVAYNQTKGQFAPGTPTTSPTFLVKEAENRKTISMMKDVIEKQPVFEQLYRQANPNKLSPGKLEEFFTNMKAQETSKEGKVANRNTRESFIIDQQNKKAREIFLSDPMAWSPEIASKFRTPDSLVGKLYTLASAKVQPGVPVSTMDMFRSLKDIENTSERAAASLELTKLTKQAAVKSSGIYFGNFADSLDLQKEMNQQISQSLLEKIGAGFTTSGISGVGAGLPGTLLTTGAGMARNFAESLFKENK